MARSLSLVPLASLACWRGQEQGRTIPLTDIAICQRNVWHRLKTAAAISTYDQTNIDGGSRYFSPGIARGFLVVRLARLAAQHPGLDIEVATDLRLVSLGAT